MDYKKTASEILENIGGVGNVYGLEHCSTRLRFNLVDKKKVNYEKIKSIKGVMKIIDGSQFQIVIGNEVVEVYEEFIKLCPISGDKSIDSREEKIGAKIIQFVINIFQPLIPAIAGAGVLKSLLMLLSMIGVLSNDMAIYKILVAISDTTFYFLPILVAITTANVLKCNRLVAVAAVGYLLLPATTTALKEGMVILGFAVQNITYSSQVFPAILCVIFLSYMEKLFNKISPKPIRIFFVPMMSLAITIPITLLILGPLGFNVGTIFTNIIIMIHGKIGFIALGLLAAILPFMIATGMHKTLLPYGISALTQMGYEMLYMPASLAHNISESGACFAVAFRTKNEELKQTAFSAGISALMGITEPALYGVTLLYKRALFGVILSGAISGVFLGIFMVKAFVAVGPGLPAMSMFIDSSNASNFILACVGFAVALFGSFIITFLIWKEDGPSNYEKNISNDSEKSDDISINEANILSAPLNGEIVDIENVNDEMFSSKTLGDGLGILPFTNEIYSPCDSEVIMLFETKHAIALRTDNGSEILIHIGINTVSMAGDGFETFVKVGDKVSEGDLLLKFDLDKIKQRGLDPTVIIVNSNGYKIINKAANNIKVGDILFDVKKG